MHLRYGEAFLLFGNGETVLQGEFDRLIVIGTCYGMEKNVDKTTISTTLFDRSKKTENVEYLNNLVCSL